MPQIMLVSDKPDTFQELAETLQEDTGTDIRWARDGQTALNRACAKDGPDLVIFDETVAGTRGLDWIRRIMAVNAFVQTAVLSRLPRDAFHEASEGLGILARLPPAPGREDALELLKALRQLPGVA